MKKTITLLLLMTTVISLFSCKISDLFSDESGNNTSNTDDNTNSSSPILETEDPYEDFIMNDDVGFSLENEFVKVNIGKKGEILSIVSNDGSIEYLDNQEAQAFSIKIDANESDIWKTYPENENNIVLSEKDAIVKHFEKNDGVEVVSVIRRESGTVVLKKHYSLDKGDLVIKTVIENRLGEGTVVTASPVIMNGVRSGARSMNCLWPFKTGTLYKLGNIDNGVVTDDGGRMVSESYPTPISMQTVILYDNNHCVSYTVKDENAEYKNFFYKSCVNKSATVWTELMPFIEPMQQKQLAPIVISCFDDGDWTKASDHYKDYLTEIGWYKKPNDAVNSFTGANGWDLNVYLNNYLTKYVASAPAKTSQTLQTSMKLILRRTGLDYMWMTGWHDGGFDTYYPDYSFSESMGGEIGFMQGIQELHNEGGKALVYLNGHMSDIKSKWYSAKNDDGITNGEACAIRKPDGSVYEETYPTSGDAQDVAVCPGAKEFQNAVIEAAKKVRANGADAIYIDQISEMRSYLCFDKSHGHSTPATAYYEGYSKMLDGVSSVMEEYGEDYFLLCEGVCDVYGKWIDIFCGYTDTNFLPLTRYTLPNKIIGRDLASENNQTYFSSAFVLGEPFICHRYHVAQSKYTNANLKRFIAIYKEYPDIFLEGKYVYRNGLSEGVPSYLEVGVMVSSDGNRSAVQIYNSEGLGEANITFSYTPSSGNVVKAYNAETKENLLASNGMVAVSVAKGQTLSIIFEYK